jgi:hypothetical protein
MLDRADGARLFPLKLDRSFDLADNDLPGEFAPPKLELGLA